MSLRQFYRGGPSLERDSESWCEKSSLRREIVCEDVILLWSLMMILVERRWKGWLRATDRYRCEAVSLSLVLCR